MFCVVCSAAAAQQDDAVAKVLRPRFAFVYIFSYEIFLLKIIKRLIPMVVVVVVEMVMAVMVSMITRTMTMSVMSRFF